MSVSFTNLTSQYTHLKCNFNYIVIFSVVLLMLFVHFYFIIINNFDTEKQSWNFRVFIYYCQKLFTNCMSAYISDRSFFSENIKVFLNFFRNFWLVIFILIMHEKYDRSNSPVLCTCLKKKQHNLYFLN